MSQKLSKSCVVLWKLEDRVGRISIFRELNGWMDIFWGKGGIQIAPVLPQEPRRERSQCVPISAHCNGLAPSVDLTDKRDITMTVASTSSEASI